eukprot:CAMPEP_0116050464 /NCGR_PEP_ID=MMETSP0322-20121206/399_1 /TAXON_ID=163516 /ORGANISM="Leptocylindrus danicus var. apora, Strain B651" /LENGTH=154 /DNA_ID=CAMNT_0003533025 /DNA_START=92 /DNA_END=556 /DNA_ORIENTATION=+
MVISRNVLMLLLQLVSLFLVKLSFAEREVITEFPEDYDAFEFVHQVIEESDIAIFSKSYCPYCKAAKATIEEFIGDDENLDLTIVELDLIGGEHASRIQSMLVKLTKQRTVPNIFIEESHIGGNSDLQELAKSGELREIIVEIMDERFEDASEF